MRSRVRNLQRLWTDERGVALALVAVTMVALLAMLALAIDLGMAYTARSEAQRVADSCSLAGASAFLEGSPFLQVSEAKERAKEYAARNYVRGQYVNTTLVSTGSFTDEHGHEVFEDVTEGMTVHVIPGDEKVRCWIFRRNVPTWFARLISFDAINVQAMAAAVASHGGTTDQCTMPFAMPDIWHDENDDLNENRVPDDNEAWIYDDGIDDYLPWDGTFCSDVGCDGIGYGSNWRNDNGLGRIRDVGMRLWIKVGPPGQGGKGSGGDAGGTDDMTGPGNFQIWRMPNPDNDCEPEDGAEWVQRNLSLEWCNTCPIAIGEDYLHETQPGNVASVKDSLKAMMDADPGAHWDETCQCIMGSAWDDPYQSPRSRVVPIYPPFQDTQGQTSLYFNNFARIFLEGGGQPADFAVYARFVGAISGGDGPNTGTLVKYLRLVE